MQAAAAAGGDGGGGDGGDGNPDPIGLLPGLACFPEGPSHPQPGQMEGAVAGAAASGFPSFEPQQAAGAGFGGGGSGGGGAYAQAMEAMPPLATGAPDPGDAAVEGWGGEGVEGALDEIELLNQVFQQEEEEQKMLKRKH